MTDDFAKAASDLAEFVTTWSAFAAWLEAADGDASIIRCTDSRITVNLNGWGPRGVGNVSLTRPTLLEAVHDAVGKWHEKYPRRPTNGT